MPRSSTSWRSKASNCCCTDTSRAVLVSSAISRSGPLANAIAIITRCRMPPDSSCGYCVSRLATSFTRTASSRRAASVRASACPMPRCRRSDSPICSPMRRCGVSEVSGSWKIIATRRPRRRAALAIRSSPFSLACPCTRASGPDNPSIERNAWLLPAPDSPITPRQRPGASCRETESTTRSPSYETEKSSTFSRASSTTRLQPRTQTVTQQIERHQHYGEQTRRHQQHPGR